MMAYLNFHCYCHPLDKYTEILPVATHHMGAASLICSLLHTYIAIQIVCAI